MKKQLLCTSAIALGVVAAPAVAQEWDLAVHGYYNQHIGYASSNLKGPGFPAGPKPDTDEAVVATNAEIHFTPSVTLDNGMTFGVNIQLEGDNQPGSQIDESYMEIKGDNFGKLILGNENSAGYKMMVGAPGVTSMYINSPSVSAYVPFSQAFAGRFRTAALSSYTEVLGNNDVSRISYFTPSFRGFTAGLSYAPSATVRTQGSYNNEIFDRKYSVNDIVDLGLNYSQSFGEANVNFGARYGTALGEGGRLGRGGGGKPYTWGVGAQVGYAGFTFGGSYAENNEGLQGSLGDSKGWSAGATYEMAGPWAFEALTYYGKTKQGGANSGKYMAYRVGVSRDIGPGVDWDLYGVYVNSKNGYTNASGLRRKVDGWGVGTAINLSF